MSADPDLYAHRSDDPTVQVTHFTPSEQSPSSPPLIRCEYQAAGLEGEQRITAQDLSRLINMAILVGRGQETLNSLTNALHRYGVIRRKGDQR